MAKTKYILNAKNEIENTKNQKNVIARKCSDRYGVPAVAYANLSMKKNLTEDVWSECGGIVGKPLDELKAACKAARIAFVQLLKLEQLALNGLDLCKEGLPNITTARATATEKVQAVAEMLFTECHSRKKGWKVDGGYQVVMAIDGNTSDFFARLLKGSSAFGNVGDVKWANLLVRSLVMLAAGEELTDENLKDPENGSAGKSPNETWQQKLKREKEEAEQAKQNAEDALKLERESRAMAEAEYRENGRRASETIANLTADNAALRAENEALKARIKELEALLAENEKPEHAA